MTYQLPTPHPHWRQNLPPDNAFASWGPPTWTTPMSPRDIEPESEDWDADDEADVLTLHSLLGSTAARAHYAGSSTQATPINEYNINAVAPASATTTTPTRTTSSDTPDMDAAIAPAIAAETAYFVAFHARMAMLTSEAPYGAERGENDSASKALPVHAGYDVVRPPGPRRVLGDLVVVAQAGQGASSLHAPAAANLATTAAGAGPAFPGSTMAPAPSASTVTEEPRKIKWPRTREDALAQMRGRGE